MTLSSRADLWAAKNTYEEGAVELREAGATLAFYR